MDDVVEAASAFFKLPSEIKEKYASDDLQDPVRYDTRSKDGISMSWAYLKHYAHPLSDWMEYWPEKHNSFKSHTTELNVRKLYFVC
jgi:hypothetical protein